MIKTYKMRRTSTDTFPNFRNDTRLFTLLRVHKVRWIDLKLKRGVKVKVKPCSFYHPFSPKDSPLDFISEDH